MSKIICGDSIEIVKDLGEFDYLLTDPPYMIGGGASRSVDGGTSYHEMNLLMSSSFIMSVIRSIKKTENFSAWIFCKWHYLTILGLALRKIGLDKQMCLVWDKQKIGLGRAYRSQHELILYASSVGKKEGSSVPDLFKIPPVSKTIKTHQFEKPTKLVKKMCGHFPTGRVIDPFCGTGGLIIGAKQLGWDVTGIDISQEFCNITEKRFKELFL